MSIREILLFCILIFHIVIPNGVPQTNTNHTIQYRGNTNQYRGIQTIQYKQYNTIQYNTIQYNTIQYNTIQYNTIQYNTIQYNTGVIQTNEMDLKERVLLSIPTYFKKYLAR